MTDYNKLIKFLNRLIDVREDINKLENITYDNYYFIINNIEKRIKFIYYLMPEQLQKNKDSKLNPH